MPGIKVKDMAYARLSAPDLDRMEEFLTDFGLIKVARTSRALYMRGTDATHHIHITELGEPKFLGFGYYADNEDDLAKIASVPGASAIEAIDEPGGGKRVRLKEPNGYTIEVVHGIEAVDEIPLTRQLVNSGNEPTRRAGALMRVPRGPTPVKRIAHGVMSTPKVVETVQWFRDNLGFIRSDDLYAGPKENIIGSFNRLDRGDDYVDHHVFFCLHKDIAGLNHVSFEVPDIDAVFVDHEHLIRLNKYEHMWGIGRHLLGSQVYDYWADPWGRVHEHWADSDRLNAGDGSSLMPVEEGFVSQWGEPPPQRLIDRVSP
jgi:catechol 2,3-dioxygenase-like lactoylglutathione lyase family enzyme